MCSRDLQLDKEETVTLMECKPEIGLFGPCPVGWSRLVPESPMDDLLPKNVYFLWLNFLILFINKILLLCNLKYYESVSWEEFRI